MDVDDNRNANGTTEDGSVNGECSYTFIIKTGSDLPNATSTTKWDDGTMMLTINPGSATTESRELRVHSHFPSETEGAVTKDFWLPMGIGKPKLLKVDLESNWFEIRKDALYVRDITIVYNRKKYRFPIKNFIYPHRPYHNPDEPRKGCPPHFLVREGMGTLKKEETEEFILKAREEDLKIIHAMVDWYVPNKVESQFLTCGNVKTRDYNKLPRFLKFRKAKLDAYLALRKKGLNKVKSQILDNMKDKILLSYKEERFDSFQHYEEFLKEKSDEMDWAKETVQEALKVSKVFREDEEFGRQMLCGSNALQIRKLSKVTDWATRVPEYLLEGKTVEDAVTGGKIFQITMDELEGVPHGGKHSKTLTGTQQTWYVVLADCLLYLKDNGKLVPVLIRLENRNDGEPETWWSPPESTITDPNHPKNLSWLYAKMWFRCADVNLYSLVTHFARGHAVNEVFAVACYRNLPNAHPIFRLLQPHLQGLIAVNVQARAVLVNPGRNVLSMFLSSGDNLLIVLDNYFRKFSYEDLIVPKYFESRGTEAIPEYFFREDISAYWTILSEYVGEMVSLSYTCDEQVASDEELQNVFKDIVDNGFRGFENGAGFPREIKDIPSLVEFLTVVILNISVFHSSVNFQTFTSYAFPPNAPTCISGRPPRQDQQVTMEQILKTLPLLEIAFFVMNVSYNLGQYSPVERFYLGSPEDNRQGMLGDNMAVAPQQEDCIRRMEDRMRVFARRVYERNEGRFLKYDVMSPINTPITTQT